MTDTASTAIDLDMPAASLSPSLAASLDTFLTDAEAQVWFDQMQADYKARDATQAAEASPAFRLHEAEPVEQTLYEFTEAEPVEQTLYYVMPEPQPLPMPLPVPPPSPRATARPKPKAFVSGWSEHQKRRWRSAIPKKTSRSLLLFLRAWADALGGELPPVAFVAATAGANGFGSIGQAWLKYELTKMNLRTEGGL